MLKLRTLEGIRRPGIAVAMPTPADKPVVVIDGGATTDCTPEILMQFAIMGVGLFPQGHRPGRSPRWA